MGALVEGTNSSPRKHLSVLNLRERTEGERDRSPGNAVRVEKEGQVEEQKRLLNGTGPDISLTGTGGKEGRFIQDAMI